MIRLSAASEQAGTAGAEDSEAAASVRPTPFIQPSAGRKWKRGRSSGWKPHGRWRGGGSRPSAATAASISASIGARGGATIAVAPKT